jgi:hypothetical protein
MQFGLCVAAMCVCGTSVLSAQSTPGTSSSSQDEIKKGTYVRRISAGATVSFLGLSPLKGGSTTSSTVVNASKSETSDINTSVNSKKIGYGLTVQIALTDHFAVAIGGYLRRMGYRTSTNLTTFTTTFTGSGSTTTSANTSTTEETNARLVDIPFLLRFYGKGRHTPGNRWFVEGGGAWRDVRKVSSSISSTDSAGTVSCCTTGTIQPAHHNARGLIAGAGAQFIDPFGIRVVPEVRYTRWVNPIFDTATTHTQRNQVEVNLSLSF